MAISVKHLFTSAKADGTDSTLVQPSNWNAEHTITLAAGKVLGRSSASAGAMQELPLSIDSTGQSMIPPIGTTGERPATAAAGMFRFNTSTTAFEGYNGTSWGSLVSGAGYATLTGTETLTNKTLTSPVINGGTLNSASVGATTPSTGAFTTLSATGNITSSGSITASGNVTAYSDMRLKQKIKTLDNALEAVLKLRGVSFEVISTGKSGIGVIAQEVMAVIPELVEENDGMFSVAYGNITALLIEAVKKLDQRISELEKS